MKISSATIVFASLIHTINGLENKTCDAKDKSEEITCSEKEDEMVWWKDLKPKCKSEYTSKGWTEELWDYDLHHYTDQLNLHSELEELDWDEIPEDRKEFLISQGWTEEKWDNDDHSNIHPYDLPWDLLSKTRQDALIVLGWTEEDWKVYAERGATPIGTRGDSKNWEEMNEVERKAIRDLGFNETTWHADRVNPGIFEPVVTNVDIHELHKYGFDYFENLDLPAAVVEGNIVGADEYTDPQYMKVSEYMKLFHAGTDLYLKYEDGEAFQKKLHSIIGKDIFHAFVKRLTQAGLIKDNWSMYQYNEENWSFWLGAKGTFTSLHVDYDIFNFLWVLEGKKRVIMIPNTHETQDIFKCKLFVQGHSCWPDVDILHNTTALPEGAVEYVIGPGQGIAIPRLAWHAVENVEPTLAFGFRIEDYVY